jgi:Tfp pilus assembly protein PilO
MEDGAMTRLRWMWRLAMESLGWQGTMGVGLFLGALYIFAIMVAPMEARLEDTRAQAARPRKATDVSAQATRVADPATQLSELYGAFPGDDALPGLLAKLNEIGRAHGVALQQADYRASEGRDRQIGQYRISVPSVTTYPQLKSFLADVLASLPNVSLDQLSLQRHAPAETTIEVQMQFTVYLRQRA